MADSTGTSWSDFPLDLAGRILCFLPAHVDRVRSAAVCPQWRAATRHGPLPAPLPLLLLSDGTVYSLPGGEPFHFSGFTGTRCIDTCGNWLVFSSEEGFFLRDPLSNATVTLPPLSRARAPLVSRDGRAVANEILEPKKCRYEWKLWLCSPDLIVATVRFNGRKQIAVCQAHTTSWWSICLDCPYVFDMAFHQGKLYALGLHDALFIVNVSMDYRGDPWISQMQKVILNGPRSSIIFLHSQERVYLVESCGVLLLVLRKLRHPFIDVNALSKVAVDAVEHDEFEVFKANLSQSKWLNVTTIGNNEVLFLRRRCSRSVSVSHNALPGDCIFFLENDAKDCSGHGTSSSCLVYSMTDGKVSTPLPMVSWKRWMVFGTWSFPHN